MDRPDNTRFGGRDATNWATVGAGSPFPPIDPKYPDLPVQKWYEYGFKEVVPRLLDLWDRVGIKVTSHMVGQAVERDCRSRP